VCAEVAPTRFRTELRFYAGAVRRCVPASPSADARLFDRHLAGSARRRTDRLSEEELTAFWRDVVDRGACARNALPAGEGELPVAG